MAGQNFTEANTLPVFRTESQDRMLKSAQNFAAGFFGIPYEGQYQQLVTIEDDGVRPLSLFPSPLLSGPLVQTRGPRR
jgi:hypothetical protein